ncbi:hypothetical protein TI39_contig410g00008 [Zymoseptoria brevis]|uniref:Cytochrome P450 like protein n=1 Tax=Zymoseptoria brevis TaxID=1047168 RepID=A0A0F4GN57_9PEZI|nr:hypothetical protein TI39_contig410g00008 [Zymoseptoria brevis]
MKLVETGALDVSTPFGVIGANFAAGSDTTAGNLARLFVVPPGGSQICGYFFPAGTCVGANAWTVHRNPHTWGEDVDEFCPERWLESSKEDLSRMNEGYMPFGLGSRTCIGKNISLLEMSKVITQLYRKFEFDFPNPAAPTDRKTNNAFFVKQSFACRGAVQFSQAITEVHGSFNVPRVSLPPNAEPGKTYSGAAWVGIDDAQTCSEQILQAGSTGGSMRTAFSTTLGTNGGLQGPATGASQSTQAIKSTYVL